MRRYKYFSTEGYREHHGLNMWVNLKENGDKKENWKLEVLENMTLPRHVEDWMDREKLRINDIKNLLKWVQGQWLGEIRKRREIVEDHDRQGSERTSQINAEEEIIIWTTSSIWKINFTQFSIQWPSVVISSYCSNIRSSCEARRILSLLYKWRAFI